MKNYLLLLKEELTKKQNVYILKNEEMKDMDKKQYPSSNDDNQKIIDIANTLGLEFSIHNLKKLPSHGGWGGANRYSMGENNMIFLYPVNDGMSTCPFEFYKNGNLIIHNQNVYSEITNLDEIILQMVRIYEKAIDAGIVIDPYYFMLKLSDKIKKNYRGNAKLVITEKAVRNQKLNEENYEEAMKYFLNRFLDHFIGWNFGVSVNRNETLRNELEKLNNKVIDKGLRQYIYWGFEVRGTETENYHGLQHYYLPLNKTLEKTKNK